MRKKILMMASLIALALALSPVSAYADIDITGTLVVGSNYTPATKGGSFDSASWTPLGGATSSLSFLYCLDLLDDISLGAPYTPTRATDTGQVWMSRAPLPGTGSFDFVGWVAPFNNTIAGEIAFLLQTMGPPFGYGTQHAADLQIAIWKLVYGDQLDTILGIAGISSSVVTPAALTMAAGASGQQGNVHNYLWFSPDGTGHQALIGSVPEPASVVFLGAFLACGFVGLVAKRKLV